MNLEEKIELVVDWIVESENFVAFTGAGISTSSGLPDYRGPNGVWTRRDKGLPPPKMEVSWDEVKPNEGHYALIDLMDMELLDYIITQNVDGLHIKSGVPFDKLAELHGNQFFMKCMNCKRKMTFEEAKWDKSKYGPGYRTIPIRENQPNCPYCGGRLISTIVNFGDPLPQDELYEAIEKSKNADVFFVVGSSLVVTPAADLPGAAQQNGAKLIILNLGETPYDDVADLRFSHDINEVLIPIVKKVKDKINQN